VEIIYHSGEWPEASIIASPKEFAAMASRIAEVVRDGVEEIAFPANESNCSGKAGQLLSALAIRVESGPVLASVRRDRVLSVSGGPESLGLFGQNLPAEASLQTGYHVHFEHTGRESFVAAESVPLVLLVA
jgi:hypothetical protein